MSIHSQLNHLIALALIDDDFSNKERNMIVSLAKANKIPEKDILSLIETHLSQGKTDMSIPNMTDDERFEYLYNIVQLMKVDAEIFLSEIRFCEELAVKLGFNRNVISFLSQKIYSDPTITSDRDKLKQAISKFSTN